jgi:hypothetical protein
LQDFSVYETAGSLLTRGELDFYIALLAAVADHALICPKGCLDVISAHHTEKWQAYNGRASAARSAVNLEPLLRAALRWLCTPAHQ